MPGAFIVSAPCYVCRAVFGFNPARVPSSTHPVSGVRHPLCEMCVEQANATGQETIG